MSSISDSIFQLKEVIEPKLNNQSFGVESSISPDGNTLVILDKINYWIYFYGRQSYDSLVSPFILLKKMSKSELKHQYILSNIIFTPDSKKCFIGVQFCDYVNYDFDISRKNFLISTMVFFKEILEIPKPLENTFVYEKVQTWDFLIGLPITNETGYQKIFYSPNLVLYGVAVPKFENYIRYSISIYVQSLSQIENITNQTNVSRLLIDPPEKIQDLNSVKKYLFDSFIENRSQKDCLFYLHSENKNIYRVKIDSQLKQLASSELVISNINDFDILKNLLLTYGPNGTIQLIRVQNLEIVSTYVFPELMDDPYAKIILGDIENFAFVSNTFKKIKIFNGQKFYDYQSENGFECGEFNLSVNYFLIGQPKSGKYLIFIKNSGQWSFFQEISNTGFSNQFDIDNNEKTLILSNQNDHNTEIYENVSSDFSILNNTQKSFPANVSSKDIKYLSQYISFGYRNILAKQIPQEQGTFTGFLYQDLPFFISQDGNIVFFIYQEINGNFKRYHFYGYPNNTDSSNNPFQLHFISDYLQSSLISITADRTADLIYLLFENNGLDIYKKVRLNQNEEYYVLVKPRKGNIADLWLNRTPVRRIKTNGTGSLIFFEQDEQINVLDFQQEPLIKVNLVPILSFPEQQLGDYKLNTVQNIYEVLSVPDVFVIPETQSKYLYWDDEKNDLYTFHQNKIKIYSEDNHFQTPYLIFDISDWNSNGSNLKIHPRSNLVSIFKTDINQILFYWMNRVQSKLIMVNGLQINITGLISQNFWDVIENNNLYFVSNLSKKIIISSFEINIDISGTIDGSSSIIHQIDFSENFIGVEMDVRNRIRLIDNVNRKMKLILPLGENNKKMKYFKTFRENKIDLDFVFHNEDFYNNVIRILPSNYFTKPVTNEGTPAKLFENSFKIYCPEVFNIKTDVSEQEFQINFNRPVFYQDEIIANQYFSTQTYSNLGSVIRYINRINDNRSLDLYYLKKKRYIGLKLKFRGGTNLVRYQLDWKKNNVWNPLIISKAYLQTGITEEWTSKGERLDYMGNLEGIYNGGYLPLDGLSNQNGIYKLIELDDINENISIRYLVDQSLGDPNLESSIVDPTDVQLFVVTVVEVNVQSKETFQYASFNNQNTLNYGKFASISDSGNYFIVGSEMDTHANIIPSGTSEREFKIWSEQNFYPLKYSRAVFGTESDENGLNTLWENENPDSFDFNINYDQTIIETGTTTKKYDDDLNVFLNLKNLGLTTPNKVKEYIDNLNNYYGKNIIEMNYENYLGLQCSSYYGTFGRVIEWKLNDRLVMKTEPLNGGGVLIAVFLGIVLLIVLSAYVLLPLGIALMATAIAFAVEQKTIFAPVVLNTLKNIEDSSLILYKPLESSLLGGNYILMDVSQNRLNKFNYKIYSKKNILTAHEVFADDNVVSYILMMKVKFSEEYIQRYHYNVIRFSAMYQFENYNERWKRTQTKLLNYNKNFKLLRTPFQTIFKNQIDPVIIGDNNIFNYDQGRLISFQNNKENLMNNFFVTDNSNNLLTIEFKFSWTIKWETSKGVAVPTLENLFNLTYYRMPFKKVKAFLNLNVNIQKSIIIDIRQDKSIILDKIWNEFKTIDIQTSYDTNFYTESFQKFHIDIVSQLFVRDKSDPYMIKLLIDSKYLNSDGRKYKPFGDNKPIDLIGNMILFDFSLNNNEKKYKNYSAGYEVAKDQVVNWSYFEEYLPDLLNIILKQNINIEHYFKIGLPSRLKSLYNNEEFKSDIISNKALFFPITFSDETKFGKRDIFGKYCLKNQNQIAVGQISKFEIYDKDFYNDNDMSIINMGLNTSGQILEKEIPFENLIIENQILTFHLPNLYTFQGLSLEVGFNALDFQNASAIGGSIMMNDAERSNDVFSPFGMLMEYIEFEVDGNPPIRTDNLKSFYYQNDYGVIYSYYTQFIDKGIKLLDGNYYLGENYLESGKDSVIDKNTQPIVWKLSYDLFQYLQDYNITLYSLNNGFNSPYRYQTNLPSSKTPLPFKIRIKWRSLTDYYTKYYKIINNKYITQRPNEPLILPTLFAYGKLKYKEYVYDFPQPIFGISEPLKDYNLISYFQIKDKLGKLYLNKNNIYNCIPEKGLIKKYEYNYKFDSSFNNVNYISIDSSLNYTPINGDIIYQSYEYENFGNSFEIYKEKYYIIGTTEGKVIIQKIGFNNLSSTKSIIYSGSSDYKNFGSKIKTRKKIFINHPEKNKLYIIQPIDYYE